MANCIEFPAYVTFISGKISEIEQGLQALIQSISNSGSSDASEILDVSFPSFAPGSNGFDWLFCHFF